MNWLSGFNPVVALAMLLVTAMVVLVGAAVLGIDKGVLRSMALSDFARGLITYLFAVMTMGMAVVLVLYALAPGNIANVPGQDVSQIFKTRFEQGKEILSLLLGIFGTIVGYYFGSAVSSQEQASLRISPVHVNPPQGKPGERVVVSAVVIGGSAPYRFAVGLGNDSLDPKNYAANDGWISEELELRAFEKREPSVVRVVVLDSSGKRVDNSGPVSVKDS
jgi:hypothetical protein